MLGNLCGERGGEVDELKRVGLVFKADGTVDFRKSIKEVSASIQENRTAFELVKSQWDENTKSMEKLGETQKYLKEQTKDYTDKVYLLQKQLDTLETSEKRDERAIQAKRSELNQAKTSLNNYKKGLEDVEQKLKSGKTRVEGYTKKLDEFGESAEKVGEKVGGLSTAAAGVVAAVAATVPATAEYRKIMGSLEVSSEMAGYTAEQTKKVYEELYGVLGDDQTAATTTANLQALGLQQEEMLKLVNATIGGWAKYGDSIPIDGLAESINETVKAGVVTGTFADILNWAGTNEDKFNEKLEKCNTESERMNLVMQEMSKQGLAEAGEKWKENNKNLVEGNKATADFQEATAELADTVAPIITEVTKIVAKLIDKFNNLPPETQKIIGIFVVLVAAIAPLISGIGKISGGISGLIKLFPMIATPAGIAITAIGLIGGALVLAYNKCEWFRDGVDKIFKKIGEIFDWFAKQFEKIMESISNFSFDFLSDVPIVGGVYDFFAGGKKQKIAEPKTQWFASGGILSRPTIFGRVGNTILGGGEAGKEAVLPIELLKQWIREENEINNAAVAGAIKEISMYAENNIYIGTEKVEKIITKMVMNKMSEEMRKTRTARGR